MLRFSRSAVASVAAVTLIACGEQSPTPLQPSTAPLAQGPSPKAALEAQVNGLINALYSPRNQGQAFGDFAVIKAHIASGRTTQAQQSIVTFVAGALAAFKAGTLQDPNGAQPPSTADALRDLLNSVAQFGGIAPPIPPSNPLGGDGAVEVVGPTGGTVVTTSGFGGVQFPAGALPADVIVVVERLPNPVTPATGPLPGALDQFPLFYDFSTSPHVATFAQPVLVGICQLEVGDPFGPPTQAVENRLQLAHPNPANPSTLELLAREPAPFVNCAGVTLAEARRQQQGLGVLASALHGIRGLGSRAAAVFRPTPLYAVHGGLGGKTTSFSPFGAVDPGASASTLATGAHHACVLANTGTVHCWGLNDLSQLGASTATTCGGAPCSTTPIAVSGGFTFQSVDAGGDATCGLVPGGNVRCWGAGSSGQLGNGSTSNSSTPVTVGVSPLKSVSVGNSHACAVTPAGAGHCWGSNGQNELGAASAGACPGPCSSSPLAVSGGITFDMVSTGVAVSCGLNTAGAAFCWGGVPGLAMLGDGTTAGGAATPTAVSGGLTFKQIATEGAAPCALTTSGQAYCWGGNIVGQVGDGTTTTRTVPTPVSGGHTFKSLASSSGENNFPSHMCGITTAGAAYCWGGNASGQLGASTGSSCSFGGPISCSTVPVLVTGGHTWESLATGLNFTCGITTSKSIYCWGTNGSGQLGNGTTTSSAVPVLVSGSLTPP